MKKVLSTRRSTRQLHDQTRVDNGVMMFDAATGEVIGIDGGLALLLGVDRSRQTGMKPWDLPLVCDQEGFRRLCARGGGEVAVLTREGTRRIFSITCTPLEVNGKAAVCCTFRDGRDDLKLSLVYEHIHDGIIIIAPDGEIVSWNPAAQEMFGYGADAVLQATIGQLAMKIISGSLRNGRWNGELSFRRRDGSEGVCETSMIPMRDGQGGLIAVLTVLRDITEYKRSSQMLQNSYDQLRETLIALVNTLASTIEMRDPYTADHQRRVTILACAIAEELGLTEDQFDGLRMACLIHDLGKITVPAEILSKPGRINDVEFSLIRYHPQICHDILKGIDLPWPVAKIILQHHERLDGSGYPHGLKGDEIMKEARILAVADVVEAMASHRPYRPALGFKAAITEITNGKGVRYDPEVVDICIRLLVEGGFRFE